MFRRLTSFFFGAAIALSGVLLHNAYRPFGLLISLGAILLGAHLVKEMYRSKSTSWLYLLGWILVILRASTLGNGGELLIEANLYGNVFVLGGAALIFGHAIRSRKLI